MAPGISTPRASKEYLKAQKRPMLNKIIKQHNIYQCFKNEYYRFKRIDV